MATMRSIGTPKPPVSTSPNVLVCTSATLVTPNAAQTYGFADGVHPSTAGHQIIADYETFDRAEDPFTSGLEGDQAITSAWEELQRCVDDPANVSAAVWKQYFDGFAQQGLVRPRDEQGK